MFAKPCHICTHFDSGKSTGWSIPAEARGTPNPNTGIYPNQFPEKLDGTFWEGAADKDSENAQLCPRCDGEKKKAPLPAMTAGMLAISRFVKGNIIIVLALVVGLIILWKQYSGSDKGKRQLQKLVMKIPVAGTMVIKSSSAK